MSVGNFISTAYSLNAIVNWSLIIKQQRTSTLGGLDSRKAQKCWAQMEFVNIYQFRFHPMLNYACVYCVRFVLIN